MAAWDRCTGLLVWVLLNYIEHGVQLLVAHGEVGDEEEEDDEGGGGAEAEPGPGGAEAAGGARGGGRRVLQEQGRDVLELRPGVWGGGLDI